MTITQNSIQFLGHEYVLGDDPESEHYLDIIVRVPTYGKKSRDLPLAAKILRSLRLSVHSKTQAWIHDGEFVTQVAYHKGGFTEVPDTNDDGIIV